MEPANLNSGDIAGGIVSVIFGDNWANMFGDGPTSSIAGLLTDIFFYFNSAVGLTTAFIVGYIFWAGSMQTAHEGQVMGKRWSNVWVPIRLVFAGGLAAPIYGFSFVQMLVLFVAGTSFTVANDVAVRVAGHLSSGGQLVNADIILSKDDGPLVSALLMSETCTMYKNRAAGVLGQNPYIEREWSGTKGGVADFVNKYDGIAGSVAQKLSYGGGGIFGIGAESCGDLSILYGGKHFPTLKTGIDLASAHLRNASAQIINDEEIDPAYYQQALDAIAAARQAMGDAVRADANGKDLLSGMKEDIESAGFIKLGVYYMRILQRHSQLNAAASFEASYEAPELSGTDKDLGGLGGYMVRAASYVQKTASADGTTNPNAKIDSADKTGEFFAGLTDNTLKLLNSTGDPYTKMISLGHTMLAIGLPVFTGERILVGVAGLVPFGVGEGLSKIVSATLSVVHWGATACIIVGAWCAFYLPMIPFISWVVGIFGIFISIVQSLFASQIWAASHALPEGDGIAGQRAQQGYMLLINLALRPVLVTMGFIFSFYLLWGGSFLVIEGISPFVASLREMSGSVSVAILGFAATMAVAAVLITIVATMSFGFVFRLADEVLAWVGSGEQLGSNQQAEKAQRTYGMMTSGRGKMGTAGRIAGKGAKAGASAATGGAAGAAGGAIKITAGKF